MSVYQINKILYLTDNDAAFRKRMKEEPEAALKDFRLTEGEYDALTSGAVGKLYQIKYNINPDEINGLEKLVFDMENPFVKTA